jgi:hypothetical protein
MHVKLKLETPDGGDFEERGVDARIILKQILGE